MEDQIKNLPTLSDMKREFIYGKKYYSWRTRNDSEWHRISAPPEWYKYQKYLMEYPGQLSFDNECWNILIVGCGKRNRKDTLLLYKVVSKSHIQKLIDNNNGLYWYAKDEEHDVFYRCNPVEVEFFTEPEAGETYDKHFAAWHIDSKLKANGILKDKEVTEEMCPKGCRQSYCYCKRECDDKNLMYEINEHSMEVEITVGFRTIQLTLEEAAEVASFLATAKEEIKKKKIAALEAQQDELKKQLETVKGM